MSSKSSPTEKVATRAAKAAELRREQERAEKRRRMLMIGGVALLFVVIIAGAIVVTILSKKDVSAPAAGKSDYGVTIGDADAPHEVIIYEDFVCPFCGELEKKTHEELAALADDGKVFVDYRPFDLLSGNVGDYPIRAANAFAVVLDASGPEVAKKMHDLLYENQPDETGPFPSDDDLVDLAVEAGAKESDVRDGIENLSMEDWVTGATKAAEDANVHSTPTVLLDGEEMTGFSSVDDMADQLLEKVS
ncbi:thioredoxin domain-containing protein [Nocardioides humilatus]|uniref:Thioredoxin domain-containing protein n=1 Tax=Nocardioides humilatus TaxID=2607660 RepID=A0A5B1LES9_9ACTN|nr:thioredoxin domain-containing protein [Nocardioides humilatus]KAA1418824.1 thioredoxin domain-containing protein [Nocardioides humilatus]